MLPNEHYARLKCTRSSMHLRPLSPLFTPSRSVLSHPCLLSGNIFVPPSAKPLIQYPEIYGMTLRAFLKNSFKRALEIRLEMGIHRVLVEIGP